MDTYILGIILTWYGLGILTCAIAWGIERYREEKKLRAFAAEILGEVTGVGHVIDYHPHGSDHMHAHCICGETSLLYRNDDPTAERLMEGWADNHIDSLMESSGR